MRQRFFSTVKRQAPYSIGAGVLSIYRLFSPRTPDTDHEHHSAPSRHFPTNRYQQGAMQSVPQFGAKERYAHQAIWLIKLNEMFQLK